MWFKITRAPPYSGYIKIRPEYLSGAMSPVTPQGDNDFDQNVLEDDQEVAMEADNHLDLKTTDGRGPLPLFTSSIRKDEPIVTRRELWSYYR